MDSSAILTLLMLVLGTGSAACGQRSVDVPSVEERTLHAWLVCEECSNGELRAVRALGDAVVPRLTDSMRRGPSDQELTAARERLTRSYRRMVESAKAQSAQPPQISENDYVTRHIDNFTVLYQTRAVAALGAIGSPTARRALEEASAADLRPEVKAQIRDSLNRLK